jgi:hypothetical protein
LRIRTARRTRKRVKRNDKKFYRKITALRDDARRNREKWRFL